MSQRKSSRNTVKKTDTKMSGETFKKPKSSKLSVDNYDNLNENELNALLLEKQHALDNCVNKSVKMSADKRKRIRNRHASAISRLRKKLYVRSLERDLENTKKKLEDAYKMIDKLEKEQLTPDPILCNYNTEPNFQFNEFVFPYTEPTIICGEDDFKDLLDYDIDSVNIFD